MNIRSKSTAVPAKTAVASTASPAVGKPAAPSGGAAAGAQPVAPRSPQAAADTFEVANRPSPLGTVLVPERETPRQGLGTKGKTPLSQAGSLANQLDARRRNQPDRLGTTGGYRPGIPTHEQEEPFRYDPSGDSRRRLPGSGLRIGTTQAAGKGGPDGWTPKHDSLDRPRGDGYKGSPDKPLEGSPGNSLITGAVGLVRVLIGAAEAAEVVIEEAAGALFDHIVENHKGKPEATDPVPDAVPAGTWQPKVPIGDPWSESLRMPHVPQPLGDPRYEGASDASNVMKGRDHAVDPHPDALDPEDGGAMRQLLSTGDAVTDPPRDPELGALPDRG